MKKEFEYPSERNKFEAFIAANPDHILEIDGKVMRVMTGVDKPIVPVQQSVTPRQIRLALNASGLRSAVENAVKSGDQDLKDWWEYALEIERHHPLIEAMGAALGKSSDDLDNLWRLAATL